MSAKKRSTYFRLLADDSALVDSYVRDSHPGATLIECGHKCFIDALCSCFTYIANEKACFLGEKCRTELGSYCEIHQGAKTYHFI